MLGMFSEKLEKVVMANDDKIARTLEAVSEQSKHLESLLESRNSNNGGGSNGRSVIVKEPPLPKLGPGQKYDDWIKQAEGWIEEMEKCWNGREGLGQYAVRLMKEMFKDCKNDEIREYANKFIVSNEDCKTFEQIKEKLKFIFGKTEKQKDKEVRTKFKGAQLVGNMGEYV